MRGALGYRQRRTIWGLTHQRTCYRSLVRTIDSSRGFYILFPDPNWSCSSVQVLQSKEDILRTNLCDGIFGEVIRIWQAEKDIVRFDVHMHNRLAGPSWILWTFHSTFPSPFSSFPWLRSWQWPCVVWMRRLPGQLRRDPSRTRLGHPWHLSRLGLHIVSGWMGGE